MKRLAFILGILFTGMLPLACQKTYTISPLPAPTATPVPTATPIPMCLPAIFNFSLTGIYLAADVLWSQDLVPGGSNFYGVVCDLLVNGNQDATATLTMTGSDGSSIPIPYAGPMTATNSAGVTAVVSEYQIYDGPYSTTAGVTYTVTAATGMGTASTSSVAPGNISIAADGSTASWGVPALYYTFQTYLVSGGGFNFDDSYCAPLSPPYSFPVSAYASGPGNYAVGAILENENTVVTNGSSGGFANIQILHIQVTK